MALSDSRVYDDVFKYDYVELSYDGDLIFIFTPPTDDLHFFSDFDEGAPWNEEKRLAYRFLRHFKGNPRGRNVYKLVDGTYVESKPFDISLIDVTYQGGHRHEVSPDEATSLVDAAYGDYIEGS